MPAESPAATGRLPVTPADLGEFAEIGGVQLTADGTQVAAIVTVPDIGENRYRRQILIGPADGSTPPAPLPLPAGTTPALLAWSPSGRALATVRRDESGWGIWLTRWPGPDEECLVPAWPDPIEELCWSPAGDRLLFVAREPADRARWELPEDRRPPLRITTLRYREDGTGWILGRPRQGYLASLDPSGSQPRKVSAGGYDDSEFGWHPDGRRVVFVSQRQAGADQTIVNDVFIADVDAATSPVRLTDTSLACAQPRVSPDGRMVAFIAVDLAGFPAVSELAVVLVDGGPVTVVSAGLDRDCNAPSAQLAGPIWDAGSGWLTVAVEDAGAIDARRLSLAEPGRSELVAGGERRITSLDERAGARVFVVTDPVTPPRLVAADTDGRERTLLAPNSGLAARRDLRGPAHRRLPVADGVTVDSWLTLPDSERWQPPYPLLVCLQGGGTQYGYQFSHEFQALTAAGFATLYLNPRGSAGYGNAWQRAVSGPAARVPGPGWGTVDVDDVAAVVGQTLADAAGVLDPARVGVQGGSYGGLVTAFLLARTDLFAAGWAERGPYNLVSLAGTNDESPWFFETYLGRTVVDDPAAYWAASALRLASQITAPVVIMHSENDYRCPIQQAEELFMALKLLGRTVEFIRFPGEGHGLTRTGSPVHRLQRLELMVDWFGRWLAPRAATGGAR